MFPIPDLFLLPELNQLPVLYRFFMFSQVWRLIHPDPPLKSSQVVGTWRKRS